MARLRQPASVRKPDAGRDASAPGSRCSPGFPRTRRFSLKEPDAAPLSVSQMPAGTAVRSVQTFGSPAGQRVREPPTLVLESEAPTAVRNAFGQRLNTVIRSDSTSAMCFSVPTTWLTGVAL